MLSDWGHEGHGGLCRLPAWGSLVSQCLGRAWGLLSSSPQATQGLRDPSPALERVSPRVAAVPSTPRAPRVPAGLGVYERKRAGSSRAPPDPGSKPWPQHRLHQQCSPVMPWQSRTVRPGASEASSVLEAHCPTPTPQPTSGLSAGLSRLSPTRSCQQWATMQSAGPQAVGSVQPQLG